MLSNLKLRTLFIAILSVLSTLVLTISVVNWSDAQLADKNASEINSIAVVQASNLRFSQIQSLRGMARIYDVATLTNPARRTSCASRARALPSTNGKPPKPNLAARCTSKSSLHISAT